MLAKLVPAAQWLPRYRRENIPGDVTAGIIVAIMLVPQSMAYALLAGLPPQVGLYASILPLLLYALFGTSRSLAVGPVAIVSLMTASAVGSAAAAGMPATEAALVLAVMSGAMLLVMGVLRVGFLINFLSHPVISGFTSAAALVIGFSQLKDLLGIDIPRTHYIHETVLSALAQSSAINPATVAIGVAAIAILVAARSPFAWLLARCGARPAVAVPLTKTGPLMAAILGTAVVGAFSLDARAGIAVVGNIPAGLPPLTVPTFDPALWSELALAAFLIAIVGFMESVSVAKALASRRRQKIDPDRELFGLGVANLGASFTGGYPVTGGFSRSVVNFAAGANTPLASVFTAGLVALTVVALTPLFEFLPRAVLAAIIVVAVANLVDLRTLRLAWRYNRADAAALIVTFAAVLVVGIELGIVAGAGLAIALHLYRTSRPHIAVVGRVGDTEHFRNIKRHPVRTVPSILAVRVDESLYFANTRYLEDKVLAHIVDQPAVEDFLLICAAVNEIDTSALETLENLIDELAAAGVTFHLAEVKGPVMDRLECTDFLERLKPGRVFLSVHDAFTALSPASCSPA